MRKKKAETVLRSLADYLLERIEELGESSDTEAGAFRYGEKVAYTECFECLQHLAEGIRCVPKIDIEKEYPL